MFHLSLGKYDFTVNWWTTLVTLLLLPLFISLGIWQMHRAGEKKQLLAIYAMRAKGAPVPFEQLTKAALNGVPIQYRRVRVGGHFAKRRYFLLDHQYVNHRLGYHVLTPLKVAAGKYWLLVDRGWVPGAPDRRVRPEIKMIKGRVELEGTLYKPLKPAFRLGALTDGSKSWPKVIQNLDFKALQELWGEPIYPFVLRLSPTSPYGFVRQWQIVAMSPARHWGYALQWFSFACALLIIYVVVNIRKNY